MTILRQFRWLGILVLGIFISFSANSQVFFTENFESGLGAFTTPVGFATTTAANSCNGSSYISNLYSSAVAVENVASLGTATGDTLSVIFDYKIYDWNTTTPTTGAFGTFLFQVGPSATGPWTTFYTLDQSNHTPSVNCATVSVSGISFPAGSAFLHIDGSWNAGDYEIYMDDFVVFEGILPCLPPVNLNTLNITATTAQGVWSSGNGSGTNFVVEIGAAGFSQGTGTQLAVTDTFIAATALMPNTSYDWYVREVCSAGDSSVWSGPSNFTTAFTPFSNPTPCAVGAPINDNVTINIPITVSGAGNSLGTNSIVTDVNLIMNHTFRADLEVFLISPNGVRVELFSDIGGSQNDFGDTSSNCAGVLNLNMLAPSAISSFTSATTTGSFVPAGDFAAFNDNSDPNGVWILEIFDDAGGDQGTFQYAEIVLQAPPTCFQPLNLNTINVTSNSATGVWSSDMGPATNFQVEIGPAGFLPGTGTYVSVTDTFINATSLMANRSYDWYVREICTPGVDTGAWAGPSSFTTLCGPALAGTYTLDAGSPVSATNYQSFANFGADLSSCGITAAVTLNVVANSGPYNERVVLGIISGTSPTNTITINGNANVLTNSTTTSAQRATLLLEGTDYLTVNDLTIEALGTVAFGVHLTDTADFNTINNCIININPTSTSTSTGGIVLSGSLTSSTSTGDFSSNNTFSNNVINGGYNGIQLTGASTTVYGVANKVLNNQINDYYQSGVRTRYQEDIEVVGNDMNRATRTTITSFYGFYVQDETPGGLFADNSIHDNATQNTTSTSIAYPIYFTSANGTVAKPVRVQNNIVYNINGNGTTYGAYFTSPGSDIQFYHNTIILDNLAQTSSSSIRGVYHTGPAVNFDHRNNIIQVNNGGTGTHYGIDFSNSSPGVTSDNNVVNVISPNSANNYFGGIGSADYNDLASWQVGTTQDANSSDADPVFTSASTGDLTPLNGAVDNIGTPLGILTDITGASRSATTPDAGAYEFTGISSELSLSNAFLTRGVCYSSNDTVYLTVSNLIGGNVDLSVDNLVANWTVTGPKNSNGSITLNSGTIFADSSITFFQTGVDLSLPGMYTLNAHIQPNAVNTIAANDTINGVMLTVDKLLSASPLLTVINNETDTVVLNSSSRFFPAGPTFTEICHFKTGTGAPVGGWPSYLLADDYVEITGPAGFDLGGYTYEQWTGSTLLYSYTYPSGTILSPGGTAIIAVGQLGSSVPSPSDYYYHGTGTFTGFASSGDQVGRILKDAGGTIVDAVGYNGYVFPLSSNVTSSDWSNPLIGGGSSSGIKREGPDLNNGSNWVLSASSPQNPNALNAGVTLPPPPQPIVGLSWTLDGVVLDTIQSIVVGPYSTSGVREYVVSYTDVNCGTVYDTAIVDVQLPVNDSCALAFELTSNGFYTCNPINSGGTANHAGATNANWFYFDAPSNGEILVSACGTLVDTRLWIMTGTCGATTDVAADDDGCGPTFESVISNFPVTSGTRYYVQWDDRWSPSGFDFLFEFNSCVSPSGLSVSNITSTSVDLNFTASDTVQIEWGPFGFTPGTGTLINNATSPQNISGLTPVTLYQYYIRNLCATGDTSAWVGPLGFSSGLPACNITTGPNGIDASTCIGSTVDLTATANDPTNTLAWYDAVGGPQIGSGSPFTTPVITGNTSYYVAEVKATGGVQRHLGPAAPSGTLTFPGGNFSNGIWFTVVEPITLDSMTLVVNDALDGSINISTDEPGAGGTLLQSFNYSLPAAGTFQIPVGVILDAGNYYMNLGTSVGPGVLFRSTGGANYPSYNLPGVASIDSTNFGGGSAGVRFYYFWDWVVNGGCSSPLDTVDVTTLPQPGADFSFSSNNLVADFTAIVSNPDSVAWDFDDGNFATGLTPQHTYAATGTYNVTMTAYLDGCDSSITQAVSITTGLVNTIGRDIKVYPNPTNGLVTINSVGVVFESVEVLDMLGNVVYKEEVTFESNKSINLSSLSDGNYLIKLVSKEGLALKRIMLNK